MFYVNLKQFRGARSLCPLHPFFIPRTYLYIILQLLDEMKIQIWHINYIERKIHRKERIYNIFVNKIEFYSVFECV